MTTWPRFLLALGLLLAAGLFLHSRSRPEEVLDREPLDGFPLEIGEWVGSTLDIDPQVREILGRGDFLQRVYRQPGRETGIDLFLAYFPSQRTGETIHSPQNCLPGAGWTPVEFDRVEFQVPGRRAMKVNRYVISKGMERQMVFYWYQSRGRVVASEYWAKIYLVADAMRFNRTDGALVRVVTPLTRGEETARAHERALEFIRHMFPLLDRYLPR